MNNPDLIARLHAWCKTIRRKPTPIADAVPMVQEAADALTTQSATIVEQAAQIEALKLAADNAEGMAGCMAMFRADMIQAGVITDAVAPMFMTEAILSKLSALRADAERLTQELRACQQSQ